MADRQPTRGKFIVLDGPEGCGKSTQARRLAERLRAEGLAATTVRDPGGTPVAERIREVLLDADLSDMGATTEMLLYMASRSELVNHVIRPAIAAGGVVVADRFLSSTVVYQGFAGGLDPEDILRVGRAVCGDVWPDRTVLLDVDADEGFARIEREHDRVERKGREYHEAVVRGFRRLAETHPDEYVLIDARSSVDEVAERVWEAVRDVVR